MAKKILQLMYQLIKESPFEVMRVARPRKDLFRRECKVWYMEVPSYFTLNEIAEAITEMRENNSYMEEELHYSGQFLVCTTMRSALKAVLYGFLPFKFDIFPIYQRWGNESAIAA